MGTVNDKSQLATLMRARMESRLPGRIERASRVKLQPFIPAHWFAAAASECASMFVDGYLYGTISVAQAYIEALTRFLTEHHKLRMTKDATTRVRRLKDEKILSGKAYRAALSIMEHRNDFHHLNKDLPGEYQDLLNRAESCINNLHIIESEVFSFVIGPPGMASPDKPEYWPRSGPQSMNVYLRNLY